MWPTLQTALFILLLVLANGLFAAAEIAIVSVRKSRIRQLAEEGSEGARRVGRLHQDAESFLATVQVGMTLVGALGAAEGGAKLAGPLGDWLRTLGSPVVAQFAPQLALAVVVGAYSFVTIVVGELVPKSLALRYAEPLSLRIAGPLLGLRWLTRPLVWLLTASANLLLKPFRDRTQFSETRLNAEEIKLLIDEAALSGAIEEPRAEIIGRAVEFGELTAADVLVPRSKIVAVDRSASHAELRRVVLEEGHTRMPVVDGSIDKVVGYITAHDVIAVIWERELVLVDDIIRPAFFVPQTMRAVDLLRALQKRHEHLAIVVDEYGGTAGLCTTEDLVEEIVGEIFSEDSEETPLVQRDADGSAIVQALMPVREFNREFDGEVPEDLEFDTVGGLVTHLAGAIPNAGQVFEQYGFRFEVVRRDERRVEAVRVLPLPREAEGDEPRA